MKKLTFLLLFMAQYAQAQYATFTPQVYKPVQQDNTILQRSLEQIERRKNEANEQYSRLQMMLAEYGTKLHNDEATLIWFDKYKKDIADAFYNISSIGWGDARDYAVRKQGEMANNPELAARIRTAKEYQAVVKNIQERSDMSQDEKREWFINNPYCFIPIANGEGKIIGGKLGTKAELEAYNAEVERKARLLEEQNRARLYAMAHPFDNFDYGRYDKVIDDPQYKFYSSWYGSHKLRICKIALSSTETRVEFEYTNTVYDWFNVERGVYIKASGTNKLEFIRAENVALAPSKSLFKKSGEVLRFALIFPAIPQKAKSLLIAEPDKRGWKFKDIKIQ